MPRGDNIAFPHSASPAPVHHLVAAALALFVAAGLLLVGRAWVHQLANQSVEALGPDRFAEKTQGTVLQAAALRQPDLLPFYGSSELMLYPGSYTGPRFFERFPTSFSLSASASKVPRP